MVYSL
ncbi:hypothetical protein D030_4515A, partial [Vibrio parahaemolyticus AQ3810]